MGDVRNSASAEKVIVAGRRYVDSSATPLSTLWFIEVAHLSPGRCGLIGNSSEHESRYFILNEQSRWSPSCPWVDQTQQYRYPVWPKIHSHMIHISLVDIPHDPTEEIKMVICLKPRYSTVFWSWNPFGRRNIAFTLLKRCWFPHRKSFTDPFVTPQTQRSQTVWTTGQNI